MLTKQKVIRMIVKSGMNGALIASLGIYAAQAATIDELRAKANQLETEINQTSEQSQKIENKLTDISKQYEKEMSLAQPQGVDGYNAKIEEAKQKKKAAKALEKEDNNKETTKEQDMDKEESTAPKEEQKTIPYPMERKPKYVAPKNNSKGRRPFIKGENIPQNKFVSYAVHHNKEALSFAKEESVQAYTGTTEENVFIFSDNLANYCKFDTNSLDKMSDCLNTIIQQRAQGSQSIKDQMNELYQESLIDSASHAISDAARLKNDSSGFEKNVLVPLQEKSSQATDERGDIEVLTLSEMEALKLKNRLLQIYATQLGLEAFKDYGTYEVNNRDFTNIDNAQ